MALKRTVLMATLLAASAPVAAADDAMGGDGRTAAAIRAVAVCYMANAITDGQLSCQPPDSMVGAVMGSCEKEESQMRVEIARRFDAPADMVEEQIAKIRARSRDGIESLILKNQINVRKCR
jgi:hypothetical protein